MQYKGYIISICHIEFPLNWPVYSKTEKKKLLPSSLFKKGDKPILTGMLHWKSIYSSLDRPVFTLKYSDTSTPNQTCSKILTSTIYYPMCV